MSKKSHPHSLFYIQVLITILVILGCSFYYAFRMRASGQEKALNTMSELSEQNVTILKKEVEKEEKVLLNLANLLVSDGNLEPDSIIAHLIPVDQENSFKRMGIITLDGKARTTDGLSMDLADRPYFYAALAGNCAISDTIPDVIGDQPITVYAAPLIDKGKVRSVLFATYSTKYYEPLLSTSTFGGSGYSYVVKSDGTCMVESTLSDTLGTYENLFERLDQESKSNAAAASLLKSDMEKGRKGSVIYTSVSDSRKYMYYQPLGINDWYLLTIVPVSVIQRDVNGGLMMTYLFSFICALLLVTLLLHTLISRERTRKELEKIAFVDKITGGFTFDRFKKEFPCSYQDAKGPCAIVVMNLERFRLINDLNGYEEGDCALRYVWSVLDHGLGEGEILSRQNADLFVLFLKYRDLDSLKDRLLSLYEKINQTRYFHGRYYELRPCFGVYEIEEPDVIDKMMDLAQLAAESIKYDAFSHIALYDDNLRQDLLNQKDLEDHFEEALKNHEFVLYYQAKYDLRNNRLEGAEALVRWNSSHAGFLMPGGFIPVFERNGSVIALDTCLFVELCRQLHGWLEQGMTVSPVSVNLSRMHLYRPEFIDEYLSIIQRYQIPAGLIQIEITETALFSNDEVMISVLNRLREYGIRILMDDFGSGYSSILMLKNLPIDILKIDKGLVDDLETSEKARIIVENIIDLSHRLSLSVVAEGVETKAQADLLRSFRCDAIQGFYYAKPLPPDQYVILTRQL